MVIAPASPRLSRRTLERTGMTREQELELLMQEQAADDTPYLTTPGWQVSLDAPVDDGHGTASSVGAEMVGRDPWPLVEAAVDLRLDPAELAYAGDLVDYLPPRRGEALSDPRKIPHGTAGGYTNHKCKCSRCRGAYAALRRQGRAARRPS